MILISGISLPLSYREAELRRAAAARLHCRETELISCQLRKRAVDARHKDRICFSVSVLVELQGDEAACVRRCTDGTVSLFAPPTFSVPRATARPSHRPLVVGSGPAGLFAALILAEAGWEPLIIERGQPVEERQIAVENFRRTGVLNTESNVQFGEGGAGTFSDGKLNTGIKDARCRYVLEMLAAAGAPEEILWQAKPHVGTDRLCTAVIGLRHRIEAAGGVFRFSTRLERVITEHGCVTGAVLQTADGEVTVDTEAVILAIGHSARDTLESLYAQGVAMEKKPFAVGVRIEHPRTEIDRAQYGAAAGHPALGAADYKLSCHLPDGRGVYTFCMCPGGVVIAAASETGGVAVNGMSEFRRDAANSNSAVLVGVEPSDFPGGSPLAGLELQRRMEQAAYRLGGGAYRAPIQLAGDFLKGIPSTALGEVMPSYLPGTVLCDLNSCLPPFVAQSLRAALPQFGRRLRGFDRYDAVLTGVESRSSSPVRLVRDAQTCQSVSVQGLYPCGEGAGYAGGITSAAVDGIRCAMALLASYFTENNESR